jgi:glycosyltransferase involved in cell wall biosynthesis
MNQNDSVLFVANVQGEKLVYHRGIRRNYSIAGNTKVFGITRALSEHGVKVGIYSPGTVAERSGRYFSAFNELLNIGKYKVQIWYGATIDNRVLRTGVELFSLIKTLPRLIKSQQINVIVVYNLSFITLISAIISIGCGCKLILEYEDSALAARTSRPPIRKKIYRIHELFFQHWCNGVYAPSAELLDAIGIPNRLLLPGVVNPDLIEASLNTARTTDVSTTSEARPIKLLYSGGLDESKGIDRFMVAIEEINYPIELHICGAGHLADDLKRYCTESRHNAFFHGLVDRGQLVELQSRCDVGLNPHRSDLHEGGSWPFKVAEYLAGCGTVFCSRSCKIPKALANRLFLYDGNSSESIASAFSVFLERWPELSNGAEERRKWAITEFGPDGVVKKIQSLLNEDVPFEWQGF